MSARKPSTGVRGLLESFVEEEHKQRDPRSPINDFFEFFIAGQLLKDHGLNDTEISSGLPSGGRDGGIDGLYLFVNGEFIQSGSEPDIRRPVSEIRLYIFQCKYTDRLPEEIINKLVISMRDLLNFENQLQSEEILERYDAAFVDTFQNFRDIYKLSRTGVQIHFSFAIAHLANEVPIELSNKKGQLVDAVKDHIFDAEVHLEFWGPQRLVQQVRHVPKQEFLLKYSRDVISYDEVGFACLVNLSHFYSFIHDEEANSIRENMFEANVRDYQGANPINAEISQTLKNTSLNADFWWLNNGVTIVADRITRRGEGLYIENPEIVNGLQTSYTIHEHFSNGGSLSDDSRHILVRIIQLDQTHEYLRDHVIRATNSQTPISPLLLHATETIHHDMEDYFKRSSPPLYYERRKSYYKNRGKKIADIVDMQTLAQAVISIILQKPNEARAQIRSFLKNNENYSLVFNSSYDPEFYYKCASIRKKLEAFLKSDDFSQDSKRRSLARYVLNHIMSDMAIMLTGILSDSPDPLMFANNIARIPHYRITNEVMLNSAERVMGIYLDSPHLGTPNAAKTKELVDDVLKAARDHRRSNVI
ncbi:MAG: AIPR family protein [Anaerolineae bacterium]|nr:AIPR family protein [Anaerolineae bacterium]